MTTDHTGSDVDAVHATTPDPDPDHVDALTAHRHDSDKIRYACSVNRYATVEEIREWLKLHGMNTFATDDQTDRRSYVSRIVNAWRKGEGIGDTGAMRALTDEAIAEFDRARATVDAADAPVHADSAPDVPAPSLSPVSAPTAPVEPPAPATVHADTTPALARRGVLLGHSKTARRLSGLLLLALGAMLGATIVTLISLSAQDIIAWAGAPTGLDLDHPWDVMTFVGLDMAAATCILACLYLSWRGDSTGAFGLLVWVFAGASAYANWSHASKAGNDGQWFFPLAAVIGPLLLEIVLRLVRRITQEGSKRRASKGVIFSPVRWIPGVGAPAETYGAWRLSLLEDSITTVDEAVAEYRRLLPAGGVRIVRALRADRARRAAQTDQ